MDVSGPEAAPSKSRDISTDRSSIKVVRGAVVGVPGVMARSRGLWRGYSHPETHVPEHKPSEFRSSYSIKIPGRKDLVV